MSLAGYVVEDQHTRVSGLPTSPTRCVLWARCSVALPLCDPGDGSLRLLCPWDFPRKNAGVDFHALLQGSPHLPGDLPNPGIEPTSPTLTGEIFTISTTWELMSLLNMISKNNAIYNSENNLKH